MTGRSVSRSHGVHGASRMGIAPTDDDTPAFTLYEAACARHVRIEERATETVDLRTEGDRHRRSGHAPHVGSNRRLDHWSFGQLATIASAPPTTSTLPAPIASEAINFGLRRFARDQYQLFIERTAPWTVHAITSPRMHASRSRARPPSARPHGQHPAWHLPLGYKDGEFGAERVPPAPTWETEICFCSSWTATAISTTPRPHPRRSVPRFILRTVMSVPPPSPSMCFLFRMVVRESHHLGFSARGGFRPAMWGRRFKRHGRRRWTAFAPHSTRHGGMTAPSSYEPPPRLGATRDAVIDTAVRRLEMSQKQATEAYTLAEQHESNPRSIGATCRTDAAESAHALARRSVRTRSRRQSPSHHGPLTPGPRPAGTSPLGILIPIVVSRTAQASAPVGTRAFARAVIRGGGACARSLPHHRHRSLPGEGQRAKQQLDAERWRHERRRACCGASPHARGHSRGLAHS